MDTLAATAGLPVPRDGGVASKPYSFTGVVATAAAGLPCPEVRSAAGDSLIGDDLGEEDELMWSRASSSRNP